MSAVTPEGQPSEPSPNAQWPLVVAVGLAGAVLGYILGAAGPTVEPLAEDRETTATTAPHTTTTTTVSRPAPTTVPAPAPALADLVPGFQGVLVAEVGGSDPRHRDLLVWLHVRTTARTHDLPHSWSLAPDADGRWVAAAGRAAGDEWYSVLQLGRPGSMYPAVLEVNSFTWHQTEGGRIAWIQRAGDQLVLWIGEVDESGALADRERIAADDFTSIAAWGRDGFVVHVFDGDGADTYTAYLNPDGSERWRHRVEGPVYAASTANTTLLLVGRTEETFVSWLTTDLMVAPQVIDWAPQAFLAAVSPDGRRLAFIGDRFELWTTGGELVITRDLDHRVWHADWSPDGRFVVAAGEGSSGSGLSEKVVLFIDTSTDEIHEVVFPDWVHRVFVRHPDGSPSREVADLAPPTPWANHLFARRPAP